MNKIKILFILSIFFTCVVVSCTQSEVLSEVQENNSTEDVLNFSSFTEYETTLDSLSLLDDSGLLAWAENRHFNSLYSLQSKVYDEISDVTSDDQFDVIKNEYKNVLVFNEDDKTDYSVYLPVKRSYQAATLNHLGLVCIAGDTICMNDFSSADISPLSDEVLTRATIENGTNTCYVEANKRKFRATFRPIGCELEFHARKPFLGGWRNYKTKYHLQTYTDYYDFGEHMSPYVKPFPLGHNAKIYTWSTGVGYDNRAYMIIDKESYKR